MEGLNTYEIPQEPVEQKETPAVSAIFGRFFGHFKTLFRAFLARKGMM